VDDRAGGLATALLLLRARHVRNGGAYVAAGVVAVGGIGIVALTVFWPVMFPRQFDLAEDRIHQTMMNMDQARRTVDMAEALPAGTYKTRDDW